MQKFIIGLFKIPSKILEQQLPHLVWMLIKHISIDLKTSRTYLLKEKIAILNLKEVQNTLNTKLKIYNTWKRTCQKRTTLIQEILLSKRQKICITDSIIEDILYGNKNVRRLIQLIMFHSRVKIQEMHHIIQKYLYALVLFKVLLKLQF